MTETLGQRITRLRGEHGMSQGDLADALDISRQSVSKWETDTSTPELEKLIRLAELFDISMDALILGKEESQPTQEPEPSVKPEPSNSIKLGYQKTPISQTQKNVGLGLIGISLIVTLILFAVSPIDGFISGLIVSSPLWGCGILCLTVRKHIGLWCAWLVFMLIFGYLYIVTGCMYRHIFSTVIYGFLSPMQKIVCIVELVVILALTALTIYCFRNIRSPLTNHLSLRSHIWMYLGYVVGYILYYLFCEQILPNWFIENVNLLETSFLSVIYQPLMLIICIGDMAYLLWLLISARMLYNEHKAAKNKIA